MRFFYYHNMRYILYIIKFKLSIYMVSEIYFLLIHQLIDMFYFIETFNLLHM